MIEGGLLLAYLLLVSAVVISPGPDTFLILRVTLASGRLAGFAAVLGVQMGIALHTLAAVLGLSVLIASSPLLFKGVAVAGAAYLAWLGIEAMRSGSLIGTEDNGQHVRPRAALRDALLCNVLNPKVIVLFLALMPNFVRLEAGGVPGQLLLLAVILVAVNSVWQSGLVLAAAWARAHLLKPMAQRLIARGSGLVFILFAMLMLYEHLIRPAISQAL
jgi:threonine/homoserine/homoserine lactone efflux protein